MLDACQASSFGRNAPNQRYQDFPALGTPIGQGLCSHVSRPTFGEPDTAGCSHLAASSLCGVPDTAGLM